jgi:hypothetical protein
MLSCGPVAAYTQTEIDDLIACAKSISDPPRREMKLDGAHYRNGAKLLADNTRGEFEVFMRRSEDFPENFSIGLVYHPLDQRGDITLLRCNGRHGEYNGHFDESHPHFDFHIHRASETALIDGFRAEKFAAKTSDYASYEEALRFFVKAINIREEHVKKYFPDGLQSALPFHEGLYGHSGDT